MKNTEIISSLPKIEGLNPSYDIYQYQGFWFPSVFLGGTMNLQEHLEAKPEDIFLCSYPKTGTTWLKALAFAIITRDRYNEFTSPLLNTIPHDCLPFMEIDLAQDPSYRMPESPLLSTHIPYTCLPKSTLESGCKIIYICREPKDVFASVWHTGQKTKHMKNYMSTGKAKTRELPSLEEEVELFCEGKSSYGPYWDHILGFWKASLESPEKVLFLRYEELQKDALFYVKRLAEFMGKPFLGEEEKEVLPEKIIRLCSFANLSSLEVNKTGKLEKIKIDNNIFFRKGEVGDWKNLLTEDTKKKIDLMIELKLHSSGFTF